MGNTEELLTKLKPMELPPLPENPLVSVLIANYNYGQYIGEAIESVLNQTYQNFEIIICDDGSTDNSLEVIKEYAKRDGRIKYIAKENGGVASALNVAFAHSIGQIICLLDADDIFHKKKIENVVNQFLLRSKVGLVLHRMQILYGTEHGPTIPVTRKVPRGYIGSNIYRNGGFYRYMPASAISLRREVANLIFPLDINLFRTEADAYIYVLSPIITKVEFLDEVLSYYRLHGKNITGASEFKVENIRKLIDDKRRIFRGVNSRLCSMGLPPLEISHNPEYISLITILYLVDADKSFLASMKQMCKYSAFIWGCEHFSLMQKLYRFWGFWLALIVPRKYRSKWFEWLLHPNKLKQLIQLLRIPS